MRTYKGDPAAKSICGVGSQELRPLRQYMLAIEKNGLMGEGFGQYGCFALI